MSKFKGGLEAYKQRAIEKTDALIENQDILMDKEVITPNLKKEATEISISKNSQVNATNRKENKDYQQVNSYVPKQLYKKVKIALVEEERGISDLITELLAEWISKRSKQ